MAPITYRDTASSSFAVNGPGPRDRAVHRELKELESEIASLGSAADQLIQQIGPVLSCPCPADAQEKQDSDLAVCDVATVIRAYRVTINRIRQNLHDAHERVEV